MIDWLANLALALAVMLQICLLLVIFWVFGLFIRLGRWLRRFNQLVDDVEQAGRWLRRLPWSGRVNRFLGLLGRSKDQDSEDDQADDQPPKSNL